MSDLLLQALLCHPQVDPPCLQTHLQSGFPRSVKCSQTDKLRSFVLATPVICDVLGREFEFTFSSPDSLGHPRMNRTGRSSGI